jgi:hypothetical protein
LPDLDFNFEKIIFLKNHLLILFIIQCLPAFSFSQYWQQQVNFTIDVSLNDKDNTLDGFERIVYTNNSPDTLSFIWFHVWPNAYKNDKTAFSDQLLENGNTAFYFSNKEERGYINRLDFKVNNITANLEDHPSYIDIIKVVLPTPLAPGNQITITTPFHIKLPFNFSRGGHDGQSYQATQWYPKPAVYDKNGWHPMPYLDQGEFYSEFGSYDITITVPQNYVVAATGELLNPDEKEWLKTRSSYHWEPIKIKEKLKSGGTKIITQLYPASSTLKKTLHFKQDRIHDFAWFADKRFIVKYDTCRLASGKLIDVYAYYIAANNDAWNKSINYAKEAIRHYSDLIGEYPYNIVQVVEGPASFGGGMEYPTITVISPTGNEKELDNTIAHEIGHNWFYGILASNERAHPWMDEGINSYYDVKYDTARYGNKLKLTRLLFETKAKERTDQPINLPADKYSEINYNLSVYYKTAEWLRYLESQIGTVNFNKAMQVYFQQWQFRHPQPEDFKKSFEESTGKNLDSIFSLLSKKSKLPNQKSTGTISAFIFNYKSLSDYAKKPSRNLILYGPAAGFNSYDKLLLGGFISNIKLPPSDLQFLITPMYATGSKRFTGTGLIYYTVYPKNNFKKIEAGISASAFTADQYKDSKGGKTYLGFTKIVPGIKFTFKEKNPKSNFNRYIQFKTFLINEENLNFYRDTVINGTDTIIDTKFKTITANRTLNQLQFVVENNRALYPYRGELRIEQGKNFIRPVFTGNYFFNYPKNGGLSVRIFAGKFIYLGAQTITKQFSTDRYHLNLTGPNGYEDYTYSDYFIGRNKFEGLASQQIMMRDGAFKVRTDLLADKVGKTDDWLLAANFSSTIPSHLNPLSILPLKIPLKLFFDLGTYAEAWKPGADLDRFLFDGGLQIPILKETVNIYIPLIYSSAFKNYLVSTIAKNERFWKKISFSIDIANFSFRKLDRNIDF